MQLSRLGPTQASPHSYTHTVHSQHEGLLHTYSPSGSRATQQEQRRRGRGRTPLHRVPSAPAIGEGGVCVAHRLREAAQRAQAQGNSQGTLYEG